MPVKKTSKPARSVKYMLSADRKLQRLSLRKIADRPSKAKPEIRSARVKHSESDNGAERFSWPTASRFVIVGAVCLLAAAALLGARQPARFDDAAAAPSQPPVASPQQSGVTAIVDTNTITAVSPARSATATPARPHTTPALIEKKPAAASMKTAERAKAATSVAAAAGTTTAANDAAVTVEGCLEFDKPTYRLKNTSGIKAPAARSWRSGFLMKRSASVELIDERGALKLEDHLGQRVAATGSLVDRKMHARTLRVISASCR